MTVAEIQRAIQELPDAEQTKLASWIAERDFFRSLRSRTMMPPYLRDG